MFMPEYCGLRQSAGLKIAQKYRSEAQDPSGELAALGSSKNMDMNMKWTQFCDDQFEHLAAIGKGNFGKVPGHP